MAINLLDDDEPVGINLLADEPSTKPLANQKSYYDLSKEDQQKAMNLARQQISAQHPNMPSWLRDMILTVTPRDESPRLQQLGNVAKDVSSAVNVGPVAAAGLMEGFSTPLRGIASLLPGKVAKDFVNEPSYTRYAPPPKNYVEKGVQDLAEFAGSLGPLGKMFSALKGGSAMVGVPKFLQNASALAGTGVLATPGDAVDKALGAAGALAVGGAGKVATKAGSVIGNKVPAFLRGLTNESTPQSLVESVQTPHDTLSNTADRLYSYVRDNINKRNISIPVDPQYLKKAEDILAKTRANKKLINNARSGDYDAIHDLQSHLYKKGTKGLASDDIALENQGDEILELRNDINDDLKNHLVQSGNVDIAHVLDQGKSVHKKLMNTYFNKNLPKGISKMVQSELRLVPKKPETLFQQDSVPMKRFLSDHPETAKHIQGIKEKEAAQKALANIFSTSAKVGGVSFLGKSLFDLLK